MFFCWKIFLNFFCSFCFLQIDNPDYKGVWQHPEIDNPEYSADSSLYLRDEICTVGLDLWQVKSGTIFDNVLITDDLAYASKIAEGVKATQAGEKKVKEAQDDEERKKAEAEAKTSESNNADDDDEDDDDEDNTVIPGEVEETEDGHDEL